MDNITMPPCTLIHQLVYDDVIAASEWLCDTFGFTERWRAGDHRAQLSFGGGTLVARAVAAGATGDDPVRDYERPGGVHRQGGFIDPFGHRWSVGDRSPLERW